MPRPVQPGAFSIDLPPLHTLRKRAERVRSKAEREALLARVDGLIELVEKMSRRAIEKRV
jgi:hypothetical protein